MSKTQVIRTPNYQRLGSINGAFGDKDWWENLEQLTVNPLRCKNWDDYKPQKPDDMISTIRRLILRSGKKNYSLITLRAAAKLYASIRFNAEGLNGQPCESLPVLATLLESTHKRAAKQYADYMAEYGSSRQLTRNHNDTVGYHIAELLFLFFVLAECRGCFFVPPESFDTTPRIQFPDDSEPTTISQSLRAALATAAHIVSDKKNLYNAIPKISAYAVAHRKISEFFASESPQGCNSSSLLQMFVQGHSSNLQSLDLDQQAEHKKLLDSCSPFLSRYEVAKNFVPSAGKLRFFFYVRPADDVQPFELYNWTTPSIEQAIADINNLTPNYYFIN